VAKDGSEFQNTMAAHLQAAANQGLNPEENPVVFYHVARLTAAEATAARVPKLEKELGAAQARVKELEALTAPGGGNSAAQRISTEPEDVKNLSVEQLEARMRQAGMS
jgi:alkylhydroperoxidase/carboxymuconolactone decarboxylase family protein YurZ